MAVIVVARLTSPAAVILTALVIGVVQSELTRFHPTGRGGVLFEALRTNLFVVALLLALLVLRRLDEPGGADSGAVARLGRRGSLPPPRGWWIPALLLLTIPLGFSGTDMRTAQLVPAFAIIFVSIVVVSGYSGQISLGQAGLAGLGALLTAKLQQGQVPGFPSMPGLVAMLVAVLVTGTFGLLVAWPAIRRRGLFLALTTFAIAAMVSRFIFAQPTFVTDVRIGRPAPFEGPRAFYLLELLCLGLALLVVRNHHHGRLGRALLAVRDDESGAHACGVDARRLRIWVFAVSAGLAALGGALLAQANDAFDAGTFDPLQGLIWFAAVVVFGIDSAAGAVLGATLIVALDANFSEGFSTIVIGAGAVLLGRMPGGALYTLRRTSASLLERVTPPELPPARLSPTGAALAARLRR
jgi:branched-chain amino acid transport system permease protein